MKALVGAFNQEKALVGAFSVIVPPVVEPMEHYTALVPDEVPESVGGQAADLLHGVVIAGEVVQTQRGPGGRQARPGQLPV